MADSQTKGIGETLLAETRGWPVRWQGDADDIPIGRDLVKAMLPFLRALVASGAAASTLRRHFGNAWALGGHIVRQVSLDLSMRRASGVDLLHKHIGDDGGPLLTGYTTEDEQRSFDSTCRRLSRFLRNGR